MNRVLRIYAVPSIMVLCFAFAATTALAQTYPFHRLNLDLGAGVTPTLGTTNNELNTGWNIVGGAGFNFNRPFGVVLQVMYSSLGVNNSVLNEFDVPGADAHLWAFTLNPIIRLRNKDRVGFYVIGGPGYYRRVLNLTEPTIAIVTVFDPFFGIIAPVAFPANQIIGTITKVGWGGNIGAGITYRLRDSGAKLFAEVRYHHIGTNPKAMDILPVTFGVRW